MLARGTAAGEGGQVGVRVGGGAARQRQSHQPIARERAERRLVGGEPLPDRFAFEGPGGEFQQPGPKHPGLERSARRGRVAELGKRRVHKAVMPQRDRVRKKWSGQSQRARVLRRRRPDRQVHPHRRRQSTRGSCYTASCGSHASTAYTMRAWRTRAGRHEQPAVSPCRPAHALFSCPV